MAYTFADYGVRLFKLTDGGLSWPAATPIVVATSLNAMGTSLGKTTQNICTVAKVGGIGRRRAGWRGDRRLEQSIIRRC